jgi:hypothetical protein
MSVNSVNISSKDNLNSFITEQKQNLELLIICSAFYFLNQTVLTWLFISWSRWFLHVWNTSRVINLECIYTEQTLMETT